MGQTQHMEHPNHSEHPERPEKIDVAAIQDMYKKFLMECPSGVLFLHEFKKFFGVEPTGEASEYAENMFRAFDKNGDNTIDFLEFVAALNLVFRGDLQHRLRWSFKVYDRDGNGHVDREELRAILESIYRVKKGKRTEGSEEMSVDEAVDRLLETVDTDGDGFINMEEFLQGAKQDPWVLNMLKLDMDPTFWVLEQRRRSAHF
ncbi:guanylyl cyclase-activating protein 2-like [Periophthalmus magnuspinnatus]|uniref:guanylyl cyclase-activating protein 2-like n=1 Tax=Periophthalmus magnuspinnatus TaxID=409849 RepID=UPI00145B2DCD|nr:guanylyl cyclase-activating protein 2-like [Periophthalmus magnuspinnatus]